MPTKRLNVTIDEDAAAKFEELKKRSLIRGGNDEMVSVCIRAAYNYLIRGKEHENSES